MATLNENIDKIRGLLEEMSPVERLDVTRKFYREYCLGKPIFVETPQGEVHEFTSLERCRVFFANLGYSCDRSAISRCIKRNGKLYGYDVFRLKPEELKEVEEASAIVDTTNQNIIE